MLQRGEHIAPLSREETRKTTGTIPLGCLPDIKASGQHLPRSLCNGLESGDGGIQPIGALKRKHPPWILRGKSADLIQLPKLVLGECEFDRREIVLKLVEAFRANDDRGYHRLCQEPCERETCRTTSMCFRDRSHHVEDLPGPLFVHDGKVEVSAARIRGLLVRPAELAGKQAAGKRTPHEQADLFGFQQWERFPVRDRGRRSSNKPEACRIGPGS